MTDTVNSKLLQLTADVVTSYLSQNRIRPEALPDILKDVHATLQELSVEGGPVELAAAVPAVSPAKSVTPDYIICLEDGKKLKMLKRYLRTHYGLTPEEYRERWKLPADYPMVAPNYAAERSELAKKIGLGRKRGG